MRWLHSTPTVWSDTDQIRVAWLDSWPQTNDNEPSRGTTWIGLGFPWVHCPGQGEAFRSIWLHRITITLLKGTIGSSLSVKSFKPSNTQLTHRLLSTGSPPQKEGKLAVAPTNVHSLYTVLIWHATLPLARSAPTDNALLN
jgi:hypothetical protein